jgi:hypothetical protein
LIAFVKNVIAHARLVKELVILIVHHVHMSISFIMALVNPVIQKTFVKHVIIHWKKNVQNAMMEDT